MSLSKAAVPRLAWVCFALGLLSVIFFGAATVHTTFIYLGVICILLTIIIGVMACILQKLGWTVGSGRFCCKVTDQMLCLKTSPGSQGGRDVERQGGSRPAVYLSGGRGRQSQYRSLEEQIQHLFLVLNELRVVAPSETLDKDYQLLLLLYNRVQQWVEHRLEPVEGETAAVLHQLHTIRHRVRSHQRSSRSATESTGCVHASSAGRNNCPATIRTPAFMEPPPYAIQDPFPEVSIITERSLTSELSEQSRLNVPSDTHAHAPWCAAITEVECLPPSYEEASSINL